MNNGAFGENFPYSNFHDLNMDWIIKIAKDFLDQYTHIQETIQTGLDDLDAKANNLEDLLQEWYDTHSADIADQLADALADLNEWYDTHSADLNAWYEEHVNYLDDTVTENIELFQSTADEYVNRLLESIPDDYSVMDSLIKMELQDINGDNGYKDFSRNMVISGANKWTTAGNGKHIIVPIYPGQEITIRANNNYATIYAILSDYIDPAEGDDPRFSSVTGFTGRTTLAVSNTITITAPSDASYLYLTTTANNQLYTPNVLTVDGHNMFISIRDQIYETIAKLDKYITALNGTDFNTVSENGHYLLTGETYYNLPSAYPYSTGFIDVVTIGSWTLQILRAFTGGVVYKRRGNASANSWEDWIQCDGLDPAIVRDRGVLPNNTDLNTISESGLFTLNSAYTYTNLPEDVAGHAGFLEVLSFGAWKIQLIYKFEGATLYKRRGNVNSEVYETWFNISGTVVEATNNYTFNEYQETVNLTATPTITADQNNYLAPSGNTADRTSDIMAMLNSTGVCRLGPGLYYVKNLNMPANTSIIGDGYKSILILISGENNYAVKANTNCLLSNLKILGSTASPTFTATMGTRHGVLWQGTFTSDNQAPQRFMMNNVWIQNFSGSGIYCYDTGTPSTNFLTATNLIIYTCWAGINIAYSSEYNKFTNVKCYDCYYGCVNNGGNNMFVNCDFSSNKELAFLIDNTNNQSPNDSHGSCIGCTFNHTAHGGVANTGTGIRLINSKNGFIFTGCQIFFSKIELTDTSGITIDACNFGDGNCNIIISGGGVVVFSNNMHQAQTPVTISNNPNVHFVNCYIRNTGASFHA